MNNLENKKRVAFATRLLLALPQLMNNKGLYLMGVIVILYSIYIYVFKTILEVSYEKQNMD